MEPTQLEERIAAFPRWHYRFQFEGGIETPVARIGQINRHEQRRRYFFAALQEIAGGTLDGLRVLDLGCNAGLWSLNALESGAQFVLGIDRHPPYVEQAELVFEAKGIDRSRYRFERGDIFGHEFDEQFDVALCLGIMEVTSEPLRLFELFDAAGAEIVVIDTVVSPSSSATFELSRVDDPDNRAEQLRVLLPSPRAVLDLARDHGYGTVALAHNMTDYSGLDDYRERRRMAFICARGSRAGGLAALAAKRGIEERWLSSPMLQRARERLTR
jgi:SAM-dependent methyltransferase